MSERRAPRKRLAGLIISTLAISSMMLAGCSSPDPGKDPGKTEGQLDSKAVINIDVEIEPTTLDPFFGTSSNDSKVTRLIYDTLYKWKDNGDLQPNLASALPKISDDLLTYTIPVRDNVKFHDGTPFTSGDVKFTLETVMDRSNGAKISFPLDATITTPDDKTVVIELKAPYTYLDARLAQMPIMSEAGGYVAAETYGTTENGTGPFKLKEWNQGQYIELESNREHHLTPPSYGGVRFTVTPETASRLTRLKNGDTDIVTGVDPKFIDVVKSGGNNVEAVDGNVSRLAMYAGMKPDRPTSDVNMRLAISYAIDRQAIVDQVYSGYATPISTYLQRGANYYNDKYGTAFGKRPDLAKAKEYLAKAGGAPDRPLELYLTNVEDQTAAATIIQANLAEIGIKVEIVPLSAGALLEKTSSAELDLSLLHQPATSSAGLAPYYVYNGLYSKSPVNRIKFADDKMDELLIEAMRAPHGKAAEKAWAAVQKRDVETQGQIQIVADNYIEAWSSRITNYKPAKVAWLNNLPSLDVMK